MNTIESLRNEAAPEYLSGDQKDAYLHKLRRNSILTWVEEYSKVKQFKDILISDAGFSRLVIESGIVKIEPAGRYVGHEYAPHVKAGFSFTELAVLMRAKIISFEEEYGVVHLHDNEIEGLKKIAYKYNRQLDMIPVPDKRMIDPIQGSSVVLYYVLTKSVMLKAESNGFCTLIFTKSNNDTKECRTIFTREELNLLETVNKAIS